MRLAVTIAIVALFLLSTAIVIGAVGKPRKPVSSATATTVFVANLVYALAIVYLYLSGVSDAG